MLKRLLLWSLMSFIFLWTSNGAVAQQQKTEQEEATVVKVLTQKQINIAGQKQTYQKLQLFVTKGSQQGQTITVENGNIPTANVLVYNLNDKVIVTLSTSPNGHTIAYISDYQRQQSLYWLFGIFIVLALVVGRERGLTALIGMGLSITIIFVFILPQILAGEDPVTAVITAAIFIVPITFYISHGFNKKTTAAIVGTVVTLFIIGILAKVFVDAAKLTGFASEEATYLTQIKQGTINLRGILFAGVLIGALGILNDITVSQAAIVAQLKETAKTLTFKEVYFKAMAVGKDHIASMINTLILVYTGAALPLLLLFVNNPHPFTEVINYEIVAEELVRTFVSSIGLILAVPITTLIASFFYQ